jgi:solute:Na+ symporter, SSS family
LVAIAQSTKEFAMHLSTLDWLIGGSALVFNILLGLWFALRARQSGSSSEFFLAGRRLTWPIVGASLLATNIGAEHMVGLCGDAYRYGFCAGANELTTVICLGLAAAMLVPYYLKNQVFTIPEFLELRYRKEARLFFSAMMLVICVVTKMAFCLYAGALVLQSLLGWDIMPTVVALALVTAVITMIGGFAAVAYTDAIHAPIMIAGSALVLFIGLHRVGGWEALCTAVAHSPMPDALHLHKSYDDPIYPFWGIILCAFYGGTFYWGIDQVNVQRLLGAKDLHHARWGAMFAILLKLTPAFIFALPGVIALVLFPGREPRTAFITILNDLLPSGIRGYVLSALVGAIISALIAVMNSISTMSVRDFIVHFWPDISERTQVRLGRVAILISAGLGTAAAYAVYRQPEGIYKYLLTISVYLVMPIAPAILFGIMSKRVTFAGAAASVLFGLALAAGCVADAMLPAETAAGWFPWLHHPLTFNYTYRGAWGTLLITAVLFVVSAFTEKTDPEKLAKTTMTWTKRPEPFRGLTDWRLHWVVLALITVAAYWWLW